MPTYQYQCNDCGEAFEIHQSFTDDALTECPNCGGKLRKLFNAVGVVFKGSGFYRTDSRDSKTEATANSGSLSGSADLSTSSSGSSASASSASATSSSDSSSSGSSSSATSSD